MSTACKISITVGADVHSVPDEVANSNSFSAVLSWLKQTTDDKMGGLALQASSNLCIGEHSFQAAAELACADHSVLSLFAVPLDQCHPLLDDSLRSSISLSNTFDEDRFLMASEPMSPPLGAAQVEKSVKLDDEWELVHESVVSLPVVSESTNAAESAPPAHVQPQEEAVAPQNVIAASVILVEAPAVEDPHAACHARFDEVLSREAAGNVRLTEVNTELDAVRAELAATKQELSQSKQDAEQLLLTAQHSMQDKINAVTHEKVEAQLRSVQLQNELQHLTSQTSTWKVAVSTLQAKSTDLEAQLAAARQDIARSSSESAVVKQELASMQEMRDQLSEEKRQKDTIQARLTQVESELEQNNLQHQSMQAIVATVQSQISEVRAQSASAQLEYQAHIDRMKSTNHAELTSLRTKFDSSKHENLLLQTRVAQLEQELRLSNAQVVARQSTATALQAQVSELRALLTLARQEIQTLIDNGKHVSESDVPRVPIVDAAPSDVASIAASIVLPSPSTNPRGPADPDQADLEAIRLAMTQSFCGGVAPDEVLTQQLIQQQQQQQQQQQEDDEFDAGTQSAELVSQVGVPFAAAAIANESLIALVRVRNTSADAWVASTVELLHVAGESFGAQPHVGLIFNRLVPRGGEHTFELNLKVPSAPGHHMGVWRLHNKRTDSYFGHPVVFSLFVGDHRGLEMAASGAHNSLVSALPVQQLPRPLVLLASDAAAAVNQPAHANTNAQVIQRKHVQGAMRWQHRREAELLRQLAQLGPQPHEHAHRRELRARGYDMENLANFLIR